MSDERAISPQQALLAVKAAGLDPDRSLTEQLSGDGGVDLEQRVADLSDQVKSLSEALGAQGQSAPLNEQHVGQTILDGINETQAKSPWMSLGEITQKGVGGDVA